MQDLTHDAQTGAKAYLVPSSMQAGNTTSNAPELAMTAPGSPSVLPVPETPDRLPMPENTGAQIPVSFPGNREKIAVQDAGRDGSVPWTNMHDVPAASRWKETS